jgi:hypothetical protein
MSASNPDDPGLRAFSGMRWMLWFLVLAWIATAPGSDFCGQTSWPRWTDTSALSLVCALWAAHSYRLKRGSQASVSEVLTQAAYNLFILAAISAPICVLIFSSLPFYNCLGQPMPQFHSLGLSTQSFSQGLEEYAKERGLIAFTGVPKLLDGGPEWFKESHASISDNGALLIRSTRPLGAVLLVPQFKDGKLTWVCNEYPHEYARAKCRVAPGMMVP